MTDLVLLHGFTQSSASWRRFRPLLAPWTSTAPDLPGHGSRPDGRRDLWQCADDIVDECGPSIYIGYSFGARVALHCALGHPLAVRGLVLISGTAGIDTEDERRARRDADEALAGRLEGVGVEEFLDHWLSQPMFAGLDSTHADRESRIVNTARGLANSLRHAGTGTQESLWSRLGEIAVPTLVVAGGSDAKFSALARRLADGIAGARLEIIDDCGHSAPFERPSATAAVVLDWLAANFSAGEHQPD